MIQPKIEDIRLLEVNDSFIFTTDTDICLIVAKDDNKLYYYRESSDHLFSFVLVGCTYVWHLVEISV
jgi:hypothetical protein